MKKFVLAVAALFCCSHAAAAEKVSGIFKATVECEAYTSFKNKTNPGSIRLKAGDSYQAAEVNKPGDWGWIRVSVNNDLRWVEKRCGVAEFAPPEQRPGAEGGKKPASSKGGDEYLLSVSWQPAFCEAKTEKPECKSQTADRFDASHFALHGLWPQPNGRFYCDVPFAEKNMAEKKQWCSLPELKIDALLRSRLDEQMPGTQSCLDRYEWTKHGSCYNGKPQQTYFEDAVALMDRLNASAVQKLFAANVGKKLSAVQIQEAFDQSFGAGAGKKVKISCKRDGSRNLIVELQIPLKGELSGTPLAEALKAASGSGSGCNEGVVDPAGLQ